MAQRNVIQKTVNPRLALMCAEVGGNEWHEGTKTVWLRLSGIRHIECWRSFIVSTNISVAFFTVITFWGYGSSYIDLAVEWAVGDAVIARNRGGEVIPETSVNFYQISLGHFKENITGKPRNPTALVFFLLSRRLKQLQSLDVAEFALMFAKLPFNSWTLLIGVCIFFAVFY